MKSYTDLKQSEKLSKILPAESADMYYLYNIPYAIPYKNRIDVAKPCWSLASLLDVLPDKIYLNNETYHLNYDKNEVKYLGHMTWDGQKCITSKANNIIDSCYEMIIKLYEQKLL